jgi:hypothetical protein
MAVGDSHTPVPDSLGPIGAPTRPFFVRVDGGNFTHEGSPLLAPDSAGGFYVAGLVRRDPQRNREELWTSRLDAAGVPLWHSVREGPRTASEQLRDLDTLDGDAIVLAAQLGTGYADPPFLLRRHDAESGAVTWEITCDVGTSDVCQGRYLEVVDGQVLVAGRTNDGRDVVGSWDAEGTIGAAVELDGASGPFTGFEVTHVGTDVVWITTSTTEADGPLGVVVRAWAPNGERRWGRSIDISRFEDWGYAGLAVATDGRIAVAGERKMNGDAGFGSLHVLSGDGTELWSNETNAGAVSALAFGPGGDLYVASRETALDLPGDYGELYGVRRTRYDRDGDVRWTEMRPNLPYDRDAAQEIATSVLPTPSGVLVASSGPSSALSDSDVVIEALSWSDPLPAAPATPMGAPEATDLTIPNPPARHSWAGPLVCADSPSCPGDCFTACSAHFRIESIPAPTGFTVTGTLPVFGDDGALQDTFSYATWFRDTPGTPWTTVWSTQSLIDEHLTALPATGGRRVVVVGDALLDARDPGAPEVLGCIPIPAGAEVVQRVLGERWLVVSWESGALVVDVEAPKPIESLRSIPVSARATPVLFGDRLLMVEESGVSLYDLSGPLTPTPLSLGFSLSSYAFEAAGFALFPDSQKALDLTVPEPLVYLLERRDCGFDLTRDGAGFTVVAESNERLPLGAALDCASPYAGVATLLGEPGGDRYAVIDETEARIRRGDTELTSFPVPPFAAAFWVGGRLAIRPSQECDTGCGAARFDFHSVETGAVVASATMPAALSRTHSDGQALYVHTYPDGVFPSDDMVAPDPFAHQLIRVAPETGELTRLPLPDDVALDDFAIIPGVIFVLDDASRLFKLTSDGVVVGSATLDEPSGGLPLVAVAGLGVFIQTNRGRWIWFDEELRASRSTGGCDERLVRFGFGDALVGVRYRPGVDLAGYVSLEAWRPTPAGSDKFTFEPLASLPSPGGGAGATPLEGAAGPSLGMWNGGLIALRITEL